MREKDEPQLRNAGKDEIHSDNPGKAILIFACQQDAKNWYYLVRLKKKNI